MKLNSAVHAIKAFLIASAMVGAILDFAPAMAQGSTPPTISVTKTVSQNPLQALKTGQNYKINITVTNGPTTQPLTIQDSLPTGITTSGPIQSSAGVLTGCPAAPASSTTGCSLAAPLANGLYVITVPITVSNSTNNLNYGANTARVYSAGTNCWTGGPASASCSGSTGAVGVTQAPSTSVAKVASQNPFVVGKAGQFYTIHVWANNGPTSSPMQVIDTLPAGIFISGPITINSGTTGTGATLSCPVSVNSSSLPSNCYLSAGLNLAYSLNVPISVTAAASSGTNTVSIISPATICPTANSPGSCTYTTPAIGVIDAVNDATSNLAGSTGTYNVATNDKYVVGVHQFSLATGSTCAGATVSATGQVSYNTPAAGASCSVNYRLCSPAPSVCDTATLTVTGTAVPSVLNITKTASKTPFVVGQTGQFYTLTITVAGGQSSNPIGLFDQLPAGIVTSAAVTTNNGTLSSACPSGAGAGSLGMPCLLLAPLSVGTYVVTIPVTVTNIATTASNTASVFGGTLSNCDTTASMNSAPCRSTVNVPILDAVNDTASGIAGTAGTLNVFTNDKAPTGSIASLGTGSTCAAAAVTSAGIASYTAPAAGSTCTVAYQLCAPAPNATVCDTATLTVTGTAPPPMGLSVTKTANQNPFVVGKAGQYYTISFSITNGPSTSPITVSDALPAGITTSGAITSSSATLAGCPAAPVNNLTGCAFPAGLANGTYAITVPITVSSTAMSGTNTVSLRNTDAICPTPGPLRYSCVASTPAVGIMNAVNNTQTVSAGQGGNLNVATNDVYPAGSSFSLTAGSTCAKPVINALRGVVTTAPLAAGTSCTVNYQVCSATSPIICAAATLTITANPAPILAVTKAVSQKPLLIGTAGQFYTVTITVSGAPTTAPITFYDLLRTGITLNGAITASGGTLSGCPSSGSTLAGCSLAAPLAVGIYTLTIPIRVAASATAGENHVQIASAGALCPQGNITDTGNNESGRVRAPASPSISAAATLALVTNPPCGATTGAVNVITPPILISVNVTGLTAGATVVLQNNAGNTLTISANGTATFSNPVASGGAYAVTVLTQPSVSPKLYCGVTNGTGTAAVSVNNIMVTCTFSRLVYVPNPAGGQFDKTECFKDNSTNLVWEGKTATGPRAGSSTFTNYDITYGTSAQISASNNSIAYRDTVNVTSLCGSNNWRLPTFDEISIIHDLFGAYSGASVNSGWILNSIAYASGQNEYWSGSPPIFFGLTYPVNLGLTSFGLTQRSSSKRLRLVHD